MALSANTVWCRKQRKILIKEFGGKCGECGTKEDLEFAHIKETILSGSHGRGSFTRIKDIRNNRKCYRLLCKTCHREYDNEKKKMSQL